jgi:hypothetical protein
MHHQGPRNCTALNNCDVERAFVLSVRIVLTVMLCLSVSAVKAGSAPGRIVLSAGAGLTYVLLGSEIELDGNSSQGATQGYYLISPELAIGPRVGSRAAILIFEKPRIGTPGNVILLDNSVGLEVRYRLLPPERPLFVSAAAGYTAIRYLLNSDWNELFGKDGVEITVAVGYRFTEWIGVQIELGYCALRRTGNLPQTSVSPGGGALVGQTQYVERHRGLLFGLSFFVTNL